MCTGNLGGGGRRGPIYRENEPPFRRKRLKGVVSTRVLASNDDEDMIAAIAESGFPTHDGLALLCGICLAHLLARS